MIASRPPYEISPEAPIAAAAASAIRDVTGSIGLSGLAYLFAITFGPTGVTLGGTDGSRKATKSYMALGSR